MTVGLDDLRDRFQPFRFSDFSFQTRRSTQEFTLLCSNLLSTRVRRGSNKNLAQPFSLCLLAEGLYSGTLSPEMHLTIQPPALQTDNLLGSAFSFTENEIVVLLYFGCSCSNQTIQKNLKLQ